MRRTIPTTQRDLVRMALDLRPSPRPPVRPNRRDTDRHEHRS